MEFVLHFRDRIDKGRDGAVELRRSFADRLEPVVDGNAEIGKADETARREGRKRLVIGPERQPADPVSGFEQFLPPLREQTCFAEPRSGRNEKQPGVAIAPQPGEQIASRDIARTDARRRESGRIEQASCLGRRGLSS